MELGLFILVAIMLSTTLIGMLGIVVFRQGRREQNNKIKADGGHGNPLASFWTWCYWKGVGMTEEEGEQEWQEYLRGLRDW